MYGIGKIFQNRYTGLSFSLLCGLGYFIIILDYIAKVTKNGFLLLGLFFFPAIVAGAALVILKTVKRLSDEENFRAINIIAYLHIILTAISIVFLLDLIKMI